MSCRRSVFSFFSLIAAALLLLIGRAEARERLNGFNLPCWSADCYSSAGASLSQLKATGAGWVALTPTWYQKTAEDSAMARSALTSTDDSLRTAIRAAKGLGLAVALKPHVDLD